MAGTFRAGKTSRAQVSSVDLTLSSWNATYDAPGLDTTNFEDNGFTTGLVGPYSLNWSLSGAFDAAQNPLTDPPGLYPRDDGDSMKLYTKVADNKFFNLTTWMCTSSKIGTTATGLVTFASDGKNQGSFTVPDGSV